MTKTPDPHDREDEGERLDRQLLELLNELRVVLPGVQVLFAFLLIVPFQQKFDTLTEAQKDLYFGVLVLASLATAMLMAPSAYHRILFRMHRKPQIIKFGSRLTVAGLACLAIAMAGAVALICDLIFDDTRAAIAGAVMLVVYGWLWFGAGLIERRRKR